MVVEVQNKVVMKDLILFSDKLGQTISNLDLLKALRDLKADRTDVLYIHSSLSFGTPNPKLKKKELLQAIFDVILELGVKTVCMPTFTFSFCNGKEYDPRVSVSKMGVLNEYFRKQNGVIRSLDPLMSVALLGEDRDLVDGIGHSSCGANSTFDKIRHRDNVKFLFLGPKIGDCLTYMHYLEWLYSVDYRYERKFLGEVVLNGDVRKEEYDLFVRYNGVLPNTASYQYEQRMYDNGDAELVRIGESSISIVDKEAATAEYEKCLVEDPHFFVDFKYGHLCLDKTFILDNEMVAM